MRWMILRDVAISEVVRFPELESLDHDRLHTDARLKKAVVANAGQRPRRS